jgi:hypothetical protein
MVALALSQSQTPSAPSKTKGAETLTPVFKVAVTTCPATSLAVSERQ